MPISGPLDVLENALRYVGFLGEQGVGVFLLLSGFGLAWSLRSFTKTSEIDWRRFMEKRFWNLYPMWWISHIVLLLPPAILGWRVSLADPEFFLSFAGIRILPKQIYYGVPAWWFFSLLVQLYLVFPIVFLATKRNLALSLLTIFITSLALRAIGLFVFTDFLDCWSRGSIFIGRLPEFTVGVALAITMNRDYESVRSRLLSWKTIVVSIILYLIGCAASLTLLGMAVAPMLTTCSLSVLFFGMAESLRNGYALTALKWVGKHSLSLFLTHHPVIIVLISRVEGKTTTRLIIQIALCIIITVVASLILERVSEVCVRLFGAGRKRFGMAKIALVSAFALVALLSVVTYFDQKLRIEDPQEVTDFGWAERPSLIPDSELGIRLRPSSTTRLRWESYDYVIESNSIGFPAPEVDLNAIGFRIMTLGDAFTSAEGVDTPDAWPRKLEKLLSVEGPVQVMNFGITGYGPHQYSVLVDKYAKLLKPNLVIIGSFTNDFDDVHMTIQDLTDETGFDKPDSESFLGLTTGRHLCRYFRGEILEPAYHTIAKRLSPRVRFYTQSRLLEKANLPNMIDGQAKIQGHFENMKATLASIDCKCVVVSIPAPTQVMLQTQLDYWPRFLDVTNTDVYDLNQPQRLLKEACDAVGFDFFDLREALIAERDKQPYQRKNLHWTIAGHDTAARAIQQFISPLVTTKTGAIVTELRLAVPATDR